MRMEDREEFVDMVAQAVIDRIEERDRIHGMVEMVVARVIALQKEAAEMEAVQPKMTEPGADTSTGAASASDNEKE